MKKTIALTAALFAAAVALALYVFHVEPNTEKPNPAAPGEWRPEPVLDRGLQIERISLVREGEPLTVKAVARGGFRLVEPIEAAAEPVYTESFYKDLLDIEKEKIISLEPGDLSIYQLEKPLAKIVYHVAGRDKPVTLLIGKRNYNLDHYFAKLEHEDTVFLIDDDIHMHLEVPLDALRSKALYYKNPESILSVQVTIEDPLFRAAYPEALEPKIMVQTGENGRPSWNIVSPITEPADQNVVKNFISKLYHTSAKAVSRLDEHDPAELGLAEPGVKILVTGMDGEVSEIRFGAEVPGEDAVYARNMDHDEVMHVPARTFEFMAAVHFREQRIKGIAEVTDITRVKVIHPRNPEKDFELVRIPDRLFRLTGQPDKFSTMFRVSRIISPFLNKKVVFRYHLPPFPLDRMGLDPANIEIVARGKSDSTLHLSVGDVIGNDRGESFTHVLDHERNCVVLVPDDVLDIIPREAEHFVVSDEQLEKFEKRQKTRRERLETDEDLEERDGD